MHAEVHSGSAISPLDWPQNPVPVSLGRSRCHHTAKSHLVPVFNLLKQHHLRGAWCVYAFAQELQIKGLWDLAGNVSGNTGNDIFSAEPCSYCANSWLQIHLQHCNAIWCPRGSLP